MPAGAPTTSRRVGCPLTTGARFVRHRAACRASAASWLAASNPFGWPPARWPVPAGSREWFRSSWCGLATWNHSAFHRHAAPIRSAHWSRRSPSLGTACVRTGAQTRCVLGARWQIQRDTTGSRQRWALCGPRTIPQTAHSEVEMFRSVCALPQIEGGAFHVPASRRCAVRGTLVSSRVPQARMGAS